MWKSSLGERESRWHLGTRTVTAGQQWRSLEVGEDGRRVKPALAAGVQVWRRWALHPACCLARPVHFLSLLSRMLGPPSKTLTLSLPGKNISSLKKPHWSFPPLSRHSPLAPHLVISLHSVPAVPLANGCYCTHHAMARICQTCLYETRHKGREAIFWCPAHITVPGTCIKCWLNQHKISL